MPNVGLTVLALIALASVEVAKTLRWRALFGAERPPLVRCLRALVAGQLTNALAPIRAGEVVRLGIIAAQGGSVVTATAALASAKAIDTLCLAAIASAVVGAAVAGSTLVPILVAVAVLLVGLALTASRLRRLVEGIPIFRRLRLVGWLEAAQSLRDPATLLVAAATTAVVWAAGLAANWLVLAAVGVPPSLDLAARVLVAGYVVGFVPAPPGRLGVFEAGIAAALVSGGVALAEAASASIVLHVCLIAELAILMLFSLALSRRAPSVRVGPA